MVDVEPGKRVTPVFKQKEFLWIPYQLAEPTDVPLTIYAANGAVVRTLVLGHQSAGIYQSRNRAAYWDGRNAFNFELERRLVVTASQ